MGDTIVDPPLQPTLPDMPVDDALVRRRRRVRAAIVVVALLAGTVVVAAALVYVSFVRFVPTASRHVPANASVVVRIDLQQLVTYAPVRAHLWPLLFEPGRGGAGGPAQPKPLAKRIDEHTGIDVRTDVREVVVASVDGSQWMAILGGRLRRGKFVSGMEQLARDEKWEGWRRDGDVLVGPGIALAQAEDGTLLAATDPSLARAALPATDDAVRLAPPPASALAFAVTKQGMSGISKLLAPLPHGWTLDHVDRMTGRFVLADAPSVEARVEPSAGTDAAALANDVSSVLGELRLMTLLSADVAGEKEALVGAKVRVDRGSVLLEAPWPASGIERACARLADLAR